MTTTLLIAAAGAVVLAFAGSLRYAARPLLAQKPLLLPLDDRTYLWDADRPAEVRPLPVIDPSGAVLHVGADENWHPAREIAPELPVETIVHTEAGIDEQTLLADFDALIDSWRTVPPWLTAWRITVDDAYEAAGLDTTAHHQWRWGAVDSPTGEYQLVAAGDGA